MKDKRSLSLIELLTVLCIIFIALGIFAIYANIALRIAKEKALQSELYNLRMSIEYYRIINGRYPHDLKSLKEEEFTTYSIDGINLRQKSAEIYRYDKQGNPLDIFMNKYYYDKRSGRVSPATKGYELW